jgi:hypothetical protein
VRSEDQRHAIRKSDLARTRPYIICWGSRLSRSSSLARDHHTPVIANSPNPAAMYLGSGSGSHVKTAAPTIKNTPVRKPGTDTRVGIFNTPHSNRTCPVVAMPQANNANSQAISGSQPRRTIESTQNATPTAHGSTNGRLRPRGLLTVLPRGLSCDVGFVMVLSVLFFQWLSPVLDLHHARDCVKSRSVWARLLGVSDEPCAMPHPTRKILLPVDWPLA